MMKKRKIRTILSILVVVVLGTIVFNYWNNKHFIVAEQNVVINELPKEFDGYRILQISDLLGEYFGDKQENLIAAINALEYDCILFTGDMNKYEDSDTSSSQSVMDLIKGIDNKETMIWVDGNTGPFAIESIDGSYTGKLTAIGEILKQMGVQVLLSPVEITKGEQSIWFVPELCQSEIQMNYLAVTEDMFENYKDYQNIVSYGQVKNGMNSSIKMVK